MKAQIRPLALDQVSIIMPIMESAFPPEFSEAWTLMQCRSTLSLPGSVVVGAFQNNLLVGFALYLTVMDNSELLLLAVDPEYRNQGIGKSLLDYWQEEMRANACSQVFLEVRENNSALSFYQREGFEIIGKRPDYYKLSDGNRLSALTMRKII